MVSEDYIEQRVRRMRVWMELRGLESITIAAYQRCARPYAMTMPGCLSKTVESVRKHKLFHWQRNAETNRAWLALNMMTEAKAGFRAFESRVGTREVDFIELRRRLAEGQAWSDDLINAVQPKA